MLGYFSSGSSIAFSWVNLITNFWKIQKIVKIAKKKKKKNGFLNFYFQKSCLNVCRSSQNCTGINLLEVLSDGLFIQLKKIFSCWKTLICTTIQQCNMCHFFGKIKYNWKEKQQKRRRKSEKVVKLVGGVYIINGATPSSLCQKVHFRQHNCVCYWYQGKHVLVQEDTQCTVQKKTVLLKLTVFLQRDIWREWTCLIRLNFKFNIKYFF